MYACVYLSLSIYIYIYIYGVHKPSRLTQLKWGGTTFTN